MTDLSNKVSCDPIGSSGSFLQRSDGNRPIWESFIFVPTCGVPLDQLEKAVGSIWNSDGAMKKIDAFMMANGWRVNGYRRENPHSTNPQDGTGYAKYTRNKKGTVSFYNQLFDHIDNTW